MTKNDWERLWMHTPWGGLGAWMTFGCPLPFLIPINPTLVSIVIGSLFFLGALGYEAFNDWRKVDHSYKDVIGIVWGYGIVGIALSIMFAIS